MSLKHTTITKEAFNALKNEYPNHVPPSLQELDNFRYEELPRRLDERKTQWRKRMVKARNRADGSCATVDDVDDAMDLALTKDELVKLVEWKLYV